MTMTNDEIKLALGGVLDVERVNEAIDYRPMPFAVSYHGDSTIVVDSAGLWVTGQVKRMQAEFLCLFMNESATKRRSSNMLKAAPEMREALVELLSVTKSTGADSKTDNAIMKAAKVLAKTQVNL